MCHGAISLIPGSISPIPMAYSNNDNVTNSYNLSCYRQYDLQFHEYIFPMRAGRETSLRFRSLRAALRSAFGPALKGDQEMMTECASQIVTHLPRLQRYARALVRDQARADDLVQDTVMRALKKLHLYRQ